MKKKLLIVAYSFPPLNSIASKRWSEMIPELEKEFDVFVFTQNSTGDLDVLLDEKNICRVGEMKNLLIKQTVYKRSFIHSIISLFTKNMRTVDSTIFSWYFKHKNSFNEYFDLINPDVILTTINPFPTAFFGLEAKKRKSNVKWVVDIRDSASLYNKKDKNIFTHFIDTTIDKRTLKNADLIFTVSDTLSNILSTFYNKNVNTVYNGFYKFTQLNYIKEDSIATLYYAGRIYKHREKAFFLLVDAIKNIENIQFNIRLLGDTNQHNEYTKFLTTQNIKNVNIQKPVDNKTILKEEKDADILILLEELNKNDEIGKGTLTGKLFEYLSILKPILVICRADSDIKIILEKTKSGNICETKNEINDFLNKYNNIEPLKDEISFYSRSEQSKRVIKLIKELF